VTDLVSGRHGEKVSMAGGDAVRDDGRAHRGTPLALIVDDDEDMREFLTMTVKLEGFATHAVSSGADAIEYLADDPADLLITDQLMPGLTGLEVATKLRGQGYGSPIVLFSAYMDGKLARACERLDVRPLSKIDIEALRRVVRTLARELQG
jgi:CheY-like chemotaxis protein